MAPDESGLIVWGKDMFEHLYQEQQIRILWLGEIMSDLNQLPKDMKARLRISRASRPEIAMQKLAEGDFGIVVVHLSPEDFTYRYSWLRESVHSWPGMIRVMLNDRLQMHQIAKASELCHRSVPFTATANELMLELNQCVQARNTINKPVVRDYVGSIERLPSLPSIYSELNDALASDATGAAEIAAIIEKDPAMAAKVLQLVNSAFFALSSHVFKIRDAVVILGIRQLRDLFLVSQLFQQYPQDHNWTSFSFENLFDRSMVVGRFARAICRDLKVPAEVADKAFLAALLQDIGMLAIATSNPDQYRSVLREAELLEQPVYAIEKMRMGVTHMEVGAYMLALWNLPPEVIEAVLFHSVPNATPGSRFTPLSAVHIADSIIPDLVHVNECRINSRLSSSYINRLSLGAHVHRWEEMAEEYAEQLYSGSGQGF